MLSASKAVSAAHIAFLASVTYREINRLVDKDVLPPALVWRDHGRRFAPLAAPLANFYFHASDVLTRDTRQDVIHTITERLERRPDFDRFLVLSVGVLETDFDWKVHYDFFVVALRRCVEAAVERVSRIQAAERQIVEDPHVLCGTPCFAGTRVPAAKVVAAIEEGTSLAALQQAYPFLSEALLEDARVYVKAHPRPGRLRRLVELDEGLVSNSETVAI